MIVSLFMMSSLCGFAQQRDVTRFLGIPVDGTKEAMKKALIAKGFSWRSSGESEYFLGEFNGARSMIRVATNNNKVCRIVVDCASPLTEIEAKIYFNRLCLQFKNNEKYIGLDDYSIPDKEDIDYQMSIKKKRYEAAFYQKLVITDSLEMNTEVAKRYIEKYPQSNYDNFDNEAEKAIADLWYEVYLERARKKCVWFVIEKIDDQYDIRIFYDNEYNRAQGEDL